MDAIPGLSIFDTSRQIKNEAICLNFIIPYIPPASDDTIYPYNSCTYGSSYYQADHTYDIVTN